MESLPIEVIELIARYLRKKDAKSLSHTSRRCYRGAIREIWSYSRLRVSKSWSDLRPLRHSTEINHLPIKRLYASDLIDHQTFSVSSLHSAIRIIYIDVEVCSRASLLRIGNLKVEINFFTDVIKFSQHKIPDIYTILSEMRNIKILTGSYNCCCTEDGLDMDDLHNFQPLPFSKLNFDNLMTIRSFEKYELISILTSMTINKIYMTRLKESCSGLNYNKLDIQLLKELNIKALSTRFLYDEDFTSEGVHPWIELVGIRTLQHIHIESGVLISLWNMKRFKFQAVEIGGRKIMVDNIVELYDHLHSDLFRRLCNNIRGFYCDFEVGPEWLFRVYRDFIIHLE